MSILQGTGDWKRSLGQIRFGNATTNKNNVIKIHKKKIKTEKDIIKE